MIKRSRIIDFIASIIAIVLFFFNKDSKNDEEDGYSKENLGEAKEYAKSVGICDVILKKISSRADWKKSKEKEKERLQEKIGAPDADSPFADLPDKDIEEIKMLKAQERMRQQGEGML